MGWTSLGYYVNRNNILAIRKAVINEFTNDKYQLVMSQYDIRIPDVMYLAIRNLEKDYVFGLVVLIDWNDKDKRDNMLVKDMDESTGPYRCGACKELIDQLTPLKDMPYANRYAWEWRKECYEKAGCIYTEPMPEK